LNVVNAGSIVGASGIHHSGVALHGGGTVSNQSGGGITGNYGIVAYAAAVTVINAGSIGGGYGVVLYGGGLVTNQSGGRISGSSAGVLASVVATVVNAGTVTGTNHGVRLNAGGTASNQSGGVITGHDGIYGFGAAVTISNAGAIGGTLGVVLYGGGRVTNQSGGVISGSSDGVLASVVATVVNAGTVIGPNFGVQLTGGGTVIARSGGTISATGTAVSLGASHTNRLVVYQGASFTGVVDGGNTFGAPSISTLELASSASAGTLNGFGSQYINFAQVSIDAGAQWDIVGGDATTALAGATISGFTYGNTIDVTNFAATSRSFSSNHLTLTSGSSSITLDMQGSFASGNFLIASDGSTGTDIMFQAAPVILDYGTTIDKAGIVAASETVAAGTLTLLNGGGTAVGTIAVGTSLSTGDFTLRPDGSGGTDVIVSTIFGTYASKVTLLTVPTTLTGAINVASGIALYGTPGGSWTVTNSGTVRSNSFHGIDLGATGDPVANGVITNNSGGYILGTGASNAYGVAILGPGTVVNNSGGTIKGQAGGVGINGTATVTNSGAILGVSNTDGGAGVYVYSGIVTNAANATISGQFGVLVHTSGATTVTNFGTIIGLASGSSGGAVRFQANNTADRLIVEPGAVFGGGGLYGGTGVLELASAASEATLSPLHIQNFNTIQFDSANWLLRGQAGDLDTSTISGFVLGDTIDITNFAATGDSFSGNHLTLTSGAGTITLDIPGNFITQQFRITNDGTGGTDINLQPATLLYGDTFDEAGIVATSETVSGGVMTLFDGASPVGTITVGTTLNTSDFTLRPDGSGGTDAIVSTVFGTYTSSVTLLTNPTTIAGTASITGTVADGIGVIGPSGTAWTLVNQGLVSETGTASLGISFASAGTITNAAGGVVTGSSAGIDLNAGGSVTNQSGGTISGIQGLYALTGAATVVNYGGISGNPTLGSGIVLDAGGSITNVAGGTISGSYGIKAGSVAATVVNAGSIGDGSSLPTGAGIALKHGGLIVNQAGGEIIAGLQGVYFGGAAGTMVNAGSIGGGPTTGNGIIFTTGGAVTNQSGGVITGKYAIRAGSSAITVVNSGSLGGNLATGGGVNLGAGSSVTNQSGGTITGLKAVNVTGGTVTNAGGIYGNTIVATGAGVQLVSGGSFTNLSSGTVSGFAGVYGKTSAATVVNAGSIHGNIASGRGVSLAAGGSVTNLSSGVITGFDGILAAGGATVENAGSIGGTTAVAFGSGVTNRLVFDPGAVFSGTVDGGNTIGAASTSTLELTPSGAAGTLSGLGTQFIHFARVTIDTGANWTLNAANTLVAGATLTNAGTLTAAGTLQNDGTIIGTGGISGDYGVVIGASAILANLGTSALIQGYGGVLVGTGGTVINAGSIGSTQGIGGTALKFTGGNARLIDDPGAVFTGTVNGDSTAVLELASASGAGTIAGLGDTVTNFTSLVFDTGSQWTVVGNDAASGLGTLGISGFTIGDTIDLTGFIAVSETFAGNMLVLTNGGDHESLRIPGGFASTNFVITPDGSGGTDVTFQNVYPPSITGTTSGQTVNDNASIQPFSGVTVGDANPGSQSETVTIIVTAGGSPSDADGTLSGSGLIETNTGTYELTVGSTTAVTTALEALVFTPTTHQVTAGDTVTTGFTIAVTDTLGESATDTTTTVVTTAVNDAPVISGAVADQTVDDNATALPFSSVTITDPDFGASESITITLTDGGIASDADGTLSGTGVTKTGTGTYTLTSGSPGAVTAALEAVVFTPTAHAVVPGGTITTGMTLAVTDGIVGSPVTDTTTSVITTAVNDAPAISGAVAGQTINDDTTVLPFSGVTIADPDAGATETVTITLTDSGIASDANGTLSGTGVTRTDTGTYILTSGSPDDVTTALEAVVFTPTAHEMAPGTTITTGMTLAVTDGIVGSPVTDTTTSVITTALNDPPVITGAAADQMISDNATALPFSGVTIADPDLGASESITITLTDGGIASDADGTLSGTGVTKTGTGTYTLTSGSPGAVTAALEAVVFTPTAHAVVPGGMITTGMTLAVTDGIVGSPVTDTTTSVITTAINDAPAISGALAGQIVNHGTTVLPFSSVTITDPDFGATETVTITLTDSGIASDATGTLSGTGVTRTGTGTYTLTSGSPADVSAALEAVAFVPAPRELAPGGSFVTGMTISVSDGIVGSPVTNTGTSVEIVPCFAAGTRLATPQGSILVERLREGDMLLTVSGKPRPVQWIGRRTLDCARHISPKRVKPIRIAAHAFGENRPSRALLLSPDHSVFVEDVLIPAKHLVNGTTVTQIDVRTVTYYHVELPVHDILLAEGLPAESYLETGGRFAFENGGGVMQLHPDFAPDEARVGMVWRNFGYAPLIGCNGEVERVRARLACQALMLGFRTDGRPRSDRNRKTRLNRGGRAAGARSAGKSA
jgi:hypothetical protein